MDILYILPLFALLYATIMSESDLNFLIETLKYARSKITKAPTELSELLISFLSPAQCSLQI